MTPTWNEDRQKDLICKPSYPVTLHAGCRQSHGEIARPESACSNKDVRAQVSAAGCIPADCGELLQPHHVDLCMPRVCSRCKDCPNQRQDRHLCTTPTQLQAGQQEHTLAIPLSVLCTTCADAEVDTGDGGRHARGHQGHGRHEQADESAGAHQDHARV